MRHLSFVLLVLAVCVLAGCVLAGCDNRQAFHRPDPSLSRMLEQRRADPFSPSTVFADGKTMREPPAFTMARDDDDPAAPPPPMTRASLGEGRAHFETICATCHGILGDGQSVVATKMRFRPPPSLHEARIRDLSDAQLFAVATSGYGWMPGYAEMLDARERWTVVSYVRVLQLSQRAKVAALPPAIRAELAKEAP